MFSIHCANYATFKFQKGYLLEINPKEVTMSSTSCTNIRFQFTSTRIFRCCRLPFPPQKKKKPWHTINSIRFSNACHVLQKCALHATRTIKLPSPLFYRRNPLTHWVSGCVRIYFFYSCSCCCLSSRMSVCVVCIIIIRIKINSPFKFLLCLNVVSPVIAITLIVFGLI